MSGKLQRMGLVKVPAWHFQPDKAQRFCAGQELRGQGLQRPALDCSLAEVQLPSDQEAAQESRLMLLSTGAGKLVLFRMCMLLVCAVPTLPLPILSGVQVLLHDRTAVGMGTTAHDVAAADTSLPLLGKQAFMVEVAYQVAPGAHLCPL